FQAAVADHEVGDGRRARLHADVDGTKRGAEVIDFDDVTPGGHFGAAVAPPLVADRLEAGAADPHAGTGERRTGRRVTHDAGQRARAGAARSGRCRHLVLRIEDAGRRVGRRAARRAVVTGRL